MSQIIDRMARAAWEAHRARILAAFCLWPRSKPLPFVEARTWDELTDHEQKPWRQFMRDGLAAAREPEDEKVIDAGWVAALNQNSPNAMFDAWQAMIDEALK